MKSLNQKLAGTLEMMFGAFFGVFCGLKQKKVYCFDELILFC
jgi:hypothetical protein